MKTIRRRLCLSAVFFAFSASLFAQARVSIPGQAVLPSGTVNFRVEYDPGREAYAPYLAMRTSAFLAAAETYLGEPFPRRDPFTVHIREAVMVTDRNNEYYGRRIGGGIDWDSVSVEYGAIGPENPHLLLHELGHYWFGFVFPFGAEEIKWLAEGIVSFLPTALARAGILDLTAAERSMAYSHWGRGMIPELLGQDYALNTDHRYGETPDHLYYPKSFFLQNFLFLELGSTLYQSFLRQLIARRDEITTNADVVRLLNSIKPSDWRALLTGWVFPGAYGPVAFADFLDADCDGLNGVEERQLGTRSDNPDSDGDLIPDGEEVRRGLAPLVADPRDVYRAAVRESGPFVDGSGSDWDELGWFHATDPSEQGSVAAFDLRAAYLAIRNGFLFVRVDTGEAIPPRAEAQFDLLVDTDADSQTEFQFGFELDDPANSWIYNDDTRATLDGRPLATARGRILEMRIPMALLPSLPFAILPILRDTARQSNFDDWNSWIVVDPALMAGVERSSLRTDLGAQDSDADGIPDRVELTAGLNPVVADPASQIARLGPFVDGRAGDWVDAAPATIDTDGVTVIAAYDIRRVFTRVKDGMLYVMVRTQAPPTPSANVMFDVLVDSNVDGNLDMEFAFNLDAPSTPWASRPSVGVIARPTGLEGGVGEVLELAIPLAAAGNPARLRILPIIRNTATSTNYDDVWPWIEVRTR